MAHRGSVAPRRMGLLDKASWSLRHTRMESMKEKDTHAEFKTLHLVRRRGRR
jgi:hypothetical protein